MCECGSQIIVRDGFVGGVEPCDVTGGPDEDSADGADVTKDGKVPVTLAATEASVLRWRSCCSAVGHYSELRDVVVAGAPNFGFSQQPPLCSAPDDYALG